jgi:hypothetical protein
MIAKVSSFAAMDEDVGKNGTPSQEVNAFLFAEVGLESSGMTLTVLSMLSRQDLDPWDEASHLASLPQKVAIKRLTVRIAGMSGSVWPDAQAAIIAGRLIVLLGEGFSARSRATAEIGAIGQAHAPLSCAGTSRHAPRWVDTSRGEDSDAGRLHTNADRHASGESVSVPLSGARGIFLYRFNAVISVST